jgi:HPt (histidine-containing phosphotransfer) domain-containing protein
MSKLQRETLDAIRELAGDTPDLLAQIVRLYLESAPMLIAQMHAGFAVSDMTAVRNAAHSLKSSSANIGATDLSKMCSKLEAAARAGVIGEGVPEANAIEAEYTEVRSALLTEIGMPSLER